jgi:hypothetical protein
MRSNSENVVFIPGDFFIGEVRSAIADLNNLIDFRGYSAITINFTKVTSCFPDAMLPLIATVRRYQAEGVRFKAIPPTYEPLRRTFNSSNWCHLIDPRHFGSSDDQRPDRFPTHPFRNSQEQFLVVNELMDRFFE